VLLLVGSYVSGRGAGNVFPDWPLMNGKVVPDLSVALFAIHFLHRVLAAIVGVLVAILAVRVIRRKREFPVQARLAHAALGLFALEILIGAGNVWTNLNSAFVTAHLLTGALIWASVAGIAIVSHPALSSVGAERPARARRAVAEAGG
jgi:heme A synthase